MYTRQIYLIQMKYPSAKHVCYGEPRQFYLPSIPYTLMEILNMYLFIWLLYLYYNTVDNVIDTCD